VDRQTEFLNPRDREGAFDWQERHLKSVFVPNWVLQEIEMIHHEAEGELSIVYNTTNAYFVLSDPHYIDDFKLAASEILPSGVEIDDYSNRFGPVRHSTDLLLEISNMTMWAAVFSGILILSLTMMLFLYDRRHEIGIYLVLGVKKSAVILQFLTEILIISFIGITIALFIGNALSNQLSQLILQHEIAEFYENLHPSETTVTDIETMFGFHEMTYQDILEASDINLGIEVSMIFYLVGGTIIALATLVPVIYILKLSPKKILL